MTDKKVNVGLIGTQFMGRAHSNAYRQVASYFDLKAEPVLHTACGRTEANVASLAHQFGWKNQSLDYRQVIANSDVDLIDICTSNDLHEPVAVAAAKAGKHIICEKPMARNTKEALTMYHAAKEAGIVAAMIFNYRFVPALALLKEMIAKGDLGEIRHFNAAYLQDWLVDPVFPMVWRHDASISGSGAHGDMNAHIVDLARFLVGEFEKVVGDESVFIKERPVKDSNEMGTVTADDATSFLARFKNGAMGNFCATRMASGCKNALTIEVFGSKGAAVFNLERLNELQYYRNTQPQGQQGFTTILVTESAHPYLKSWWPPGHIIGWEHTFTHLFSELFQAIAGQPSNVPDFYDGVKCQMVLDAVAKSCKDGRWITIDQFDR